MIGTVLTNQQPELKPVLYNLASIILEMY